MRLVSIFILLLFISGCAKTTNTEDATSNTAMAAGQAECYKAFYGFKQSQIEKTTSSTEMMLYQAIDKLGDHHNPCEGFTNSYDAEVVYYEGLADMIENALDLGKTMITVGGKVWMFAIGVDGVTDLVDQSGTTYTVTGDYISGSPNMSTTTSTATTSTASEFLVP